MGAKISTFFYCLGTERPGDNSAPLNAIGVLQALVPEFIPSAFSFAIVLGIVGVRDNNVHTLDIIFKDNHGDALVEAKSINLPVMDSDDKGLDLPIEASGIMLGMDLKNVILREEGTYSTCILFDGKHLGDYDIYVKGKN